MKPSPRPFPQEALTPVIDALAPYTDVSSAFAAIITAVIAIVALSSTARDSRDRSRPLVMALFRAAEHSDSAFELVVRNFGTSAARHLTVTFDPPLSEDDRKDELTDFISKRYDVAISLLPPGSELTNTWWRGKNAGGNELVNGLNTPEEVAVTVRYKGNRIRRYQDTFRLHADLIKLTTYSVSSTSTPGRMKTIADSLKTIAAQSTATNKLVHEIGHRLAVDKPEPEHESPSSSKVRRGIRGMLASFRPGS